MKLKLVLTMYLFFHRTVGLGSPTASQGKITSVLQEEYTVVVKLAILAATARYKMNKHLPQRTINFKETKSSPKNNCHFTYIFFWSCVF